MELGSNSYNVSATQNSQPMVPIGINLQSGANALQTAKLVKEKMENITALKDVIIFIFSEFRTEQQKQPTSSYYRNMNF